MAGPTDGVASHGHIRDAHGGGIREQAEYLAKLVKDDFEKWGKVIRDAKIKAD